MNKASFWIRLCLVGSALMLIAKIAHAQGSAPLSFEALPRAHKTDTVRVSASSRREVVVNLREQIVAQRDSILKLNRALAAPAPQVRAQPATPTRVDTVRAIRVDTAHVIQVRPDTAAAVAKPVQPAAPAAVLAATPKPAAPSAPVFAPTSVSGLLQIMMSGGDSALRSTYRVRRAEVKVVSDLGRHAQAIIMVDLAKALSLTTNGTTSSVTQSSRILQDAVLSMPLKRVQIDAGQQRLPLGYEGSMSASTLETVDRALMESDKARGASFGDVRDLGVAAKGKWRWLDYRAGVFNGSGETMNDVDKNVGKAVVGQLALRPSFVKGLRIGSSAVTSGKGTLDKPTRDRVGAELLYVRGRAVVQAEAMHGQDGAVTRQGMYALGAFNLLPSLKLTTRFDAWDPDVQKDAAAADVTERDYLAGLTWLPVATRLKVQFAVVRKTYTRDITPSATLALTQIQASW